MQPLDQPYLRSRLLANRGKEANLEPVVGSTITPDDACWLTCSGCRGCPYHWVGLNSGSYCGWHHSVPSLLGRRRCLRGDNTLAEQTGHCNRTDTWDSGDTYEPYVGRWSRLVAREFPEWLAVPPGARWLDVGCGTGALAQTILALTAPREVVGIDPSPAYVAFARARSNDMRATFEVGDAQALREASATFDAVVAGLVLNFVPEPEKALSEIARVARPGGTVAAHVWDYAEGMQLMRYFWDAAAALDPRVRELDEARRFTLCKPEQLTNLFWTTGLEKVEARAVDVPTVFRDFDDYWSPFLGGQGPAPSYAMSLSEERRAALRERIRTSLPTGSLGEHRLIARAWAAQGVR